MEIPPFQLHHWAARRRGRSVIGRIFAAATREPRRRQPMVIAGLGHGGGIVGNMRPRLAWLFLSGIFLAIGACASLAASGVASPTGPAVECHDPTPPNELVRGANVTVVDGDTVRARVEGRNELVRLIGIDAPETRSLPHMDRQARSWSRSRETVRALGEQAKAYAMARLDRRDVGLSTDVRTRDRYGRLLAYVWLPDDVLFNRLIVEDGYAVASPFPPNVRYAALLRSCEDQARIGGRGLWRPR